MKEYNYEFSIIIPTYNRAVQLDRCLLSVVTQTSKNFEIIVADDGSTDETKSVVQKYKDTYPAVSIQYIYSENWGGPAKPRNLALQLSSGKWICFLDSDDWYVDTRLEYLSTSNIDSFDFIYHDLIIIKDGAKYGSTKSRQLKGDCFQDLLFNLNTIATSSTCIRKTVLTDVGGFKEEKEIIGLEDFDLWLRVARENIRFKHVSQNLGYYNLGDDNITFYDERQINRLKSVYTYYINMQVGAIEKNKASGALNYLIARIYLLNKNSHGFFQHIGLSLRRGSSLIKLKSVYQVFMFYRSKIFV